MSQLNTPMSRLVCCFWFVYVIKVAMVGLFFADRASMGTLVNFGISCFFAIAATVVSRARFRRPESDLWGVVIVMYLGWSLLSLAWTESESKAVALFYWGAMAVDVFVVWLMVAGARGTSLVKGSLYGIVGGGVTLVILMFTSFKIGSSGRIEDVIVHTNTLGNQLGMALIAALSLTQVSRLSPVLRVVLLFAIAILALGLVKTLSKTSIVAFLAAYFVMLLFTLRRFPLRALPVLLILAATCLLFWSDLQSYLAEYVFSRSVGDDSAADTLSGRTILWQEVLSMILGRPLMGYGFMSFRDAGPQIFGANLVHAHNELLQQWFSLGFPGVVLTIWIYWLSLRSWLRRPRKLRVDSATQYDNLHLLGLCLSCYFLVRGLTEAAVFGLVFPLPLLLLLLMRQRSASHV